MFLRLFFYRLYLILILVAFSSATMAQDEEHEGHTHGSEQDTVQQDTAEHEEETSVGIIPAEEQVPATNESVFASFSDFPTLHPLVVHFPIVLLFVAFVAQLFGLFVRRREMSWVTLVLLAGGFAGALLAAQVFHPHVADLTPRVQEIFETHEYYASVTTWLAGIALLFKIISHFWINRRTWTEIMVFLVITGSVITVSLAGHLGTQMAYIENVGPQGNYLEQNHDHE